MKEYVMSKQVCSYDNSDIIDVRKRQYLRMLSWGLHYN